MAPETPATEPLLRPARVADGPAIAGLIAPFAAADLMLPRPLPRLYEHLRDFQVAELDGRLVGCVALHLFDAELAEIKSLAVAPDRHRSGLGTRLIEQALADARALGLRRLFALVLRPGPFARLGFREAPRESLPQKVWGECIFCPKYHRCDEIALVREL